MRKGLIRSYDNGSGIGILFDFEEEMTLTFSGFAGLGFATGSRVQYELSKTGSDYTAQAVVSNLSAE